MIGRLPPELLQLVLKYGAGTEARDALTFSHVTHTWRLISLRTPSLWVVLDSRLGPSCASVFLERSRLESLDVRVVQRGLYLDDNYDLRLKSFFRTALQHASRWSKFTVDASLVRVIELATTHVANFVFSPTGQHIPTLDAAIFHVNSNVAHDVTVQGNYYREMRVAPFCMRMLTLHSVSCWESGYYTPELRCLHLCNLEGGRIADVLDLKGLGRILAHAPRLEELVFDCSGPRLEYGDAEDVEAASLITFHIRGEVGAVGLTRLFSQLRLPVLRSLHLDIAGTRDEMLFTLSLLPRTTPLVDLRIKRRFRGQPSTKRRRRKNVEVVPDSPTPWAECIGFPLLAILILDNADIDEPAIMSLAHLPHLAHLELYCEDNVDHAILSAFLRRRLDNTDVCAIRYLRVEWCRHLGVASVTALRELVPTVECREATEDSEDGDYETDSDHDITDDSDSEPDACIEEIEHQIGNDP